MTDHITIAIDAMGGENSPDKTIEGISHHLKNSDNSFYLIFGNEKLINPLIKKNRITKLIIIKSIAIFFDFLL